MRTPCQRSMIAIGRRAGHKPRPAGLPARRQIARALAGRLSAARQLRRIESLLGRQIVHRGGERRLKSLHGGGGKSTAADALELCPRGARMRNWTITDHAVDLTEAPYVVGAHAAGRADVAETGVGNGQGMRPPSTTVKDFMSQLQPRASIGSPLQSRGDLFRKNVL